MTENGKTRRWVIVGVVATVVSALGPNGSWGPLLWRRRPREGDLKTDLRAEGGGGVTPKPATIAVPDGPLVVTLDVGHTA